MDGVIQAAGISSLKKNQIRTSRDLIDETGDNNATGNFPTTAGHANISSNQ